MRQLTRVCYPALFFASLLAGLPQVAWAQEKEAIAIEAEAGPAGTSAEPEAPPHVLDRGDNAWMLISSALVLMMTAPGLAMFYGGLVRKKNVVSVIMQCIFLMGLMTVIWGTVGYSLCFGGTDAWIGNTDHFFMRGLQATYTEGKGSDIPLHPTLNIPFYTHMLFQGMFFIITPALICGAFAERMKFSTMVVFMTLWGMLVYCPLCHWVWGGGIFAYGSEHAKTICAGGASISPAVRWCTSARACRRWSALWYRQTHRIPAPSPCRRTT